MCFEFFETTIGEQVTLQRGFDITKKEQRPGRVPVISSGGISSYHDEAAVKGPGVVLGRKGSLGTVFYIEEDYWPHDTSLWVKDFKGNNPRFVYYFFKSISDELKKMDVGAANPALNRNHVHPMPVRWPRRETQNQIVAILSSLDDKIELNRQTNQTLEQIAQAIFKSWFVDFDPVRAKIAAREAFIQQHPEVTAEAIRAAAKACELAAICAISGKTEEQLNKLNAEALQQLKTTAAFFPDTLVDTEYGELPQGWIYKALDEIAHYQNGLALHKFRPNEGEKSLPVLKIAQLSKGFTDGEERASANIKQECVVDNGDIVFSWSGSLMADVWCGGKAALNQHLFKVTSEIYPKWFYYLYTKHHLSTFQQIAADKAVTMGHIKRGHLSEAMCAVPASGIGDMSLMSDLLNKQIELRIECVSLKEVRDNLLPKLLSGEVDLNKNMEVA